MDILNECVVEYYFYVKFVAYCKVWAIKAMIINRPFENFYIEENIFFPCIYWLNIVYGVKINLN